MNSVEARKALDKWAHNECLGEYGFFDHEKYHDYAAKQDAYGDARELKGHVAVCPAYTVTDQRLDCGQHGWYCDRAPQGGRDGDSS